MRYRAICIGRELQRLTGEPYYIPDQHGYGPLEADTREELVQAIEATPYGTAFLIKEIHNDPN